jgi:uncharacterized protein (TIGR03435 family)
LLLLLANEVIAQTNRGPAFEVASIKPSAPDETMSATAMPPGGRIEISNLTLKALIEDAWHIQPYQISGGPSWLDSAHYDISAKAASAQPGDVLKREDVLRMLQTLLEDRFHLVLRREVRQLPIYELVRARKDGKLGQKLVESKAGGCVQFDPVNPFTVDTMKLCGNFALGPDGLTLVSAPISTLTPLLSRLLGRTVIDKTGLTKNYDIEIEWMPDESLAMQLPPDAPRPPPGGPSIFQVFRDQLGLELKGNKGPVEIFVIESAEKPAEN